MEKDLLGLEKETLLLDYFNGELDDAQSAVVERWLDAAPENREEFDRLVKDCLHIRWAGKEQLVDAVKGKKLMLRRINGTKVRRVWYGAVASIAIIVALGGVYLMNKPLPEKKSIARNEVICHGFPRASLVLSSGEVIDLADNKNAILEQDGSVVKMKDGKGIEYNTGQAGTANQVIYNKIIVPRGGEFFVILADGTEVWLNADSELEYPVKFTADKREVRLKGEAYFSVKKDTKKPFMVRSGEYQLKVYGTEFNLNTYKNNEIQAVLVKGSVGFKANRTAGEVRLKPNQLGVANEATGKAEVKEVDVYPYIAWKSQDVVFVNERLESIMEKAARWYDVNVFFQNESLKDLRFFGNMQRYADIQELLFFLENTSDARFSVKDRIVIVRAK